jgi:ABC-type transport system involved in Fe-S cluster assembly, permease component
MSNFKAINSIPVRTWKWLNVNDTAVKYEINEIVKYKKNPIVTLPKAVIVLENYDIDKKVLDIIGCEKSISNFVEINTNTKYIFSIPKDCTVIEPLVISYEIDKENAAVIDDIVIIAEANSEINVLVKYEGNDNTACFHAGRFIVVAKEGAKVKVTKSQFLNDESVHVDTSCAVAGENAEVRFLYTEVGAKQIAVHSTVVANGRNANAEIYSMYYGDKDRELDFNYKLVYNAPETTGNMGVRGILNDASKKTFRGTLDFVSGAKGSKGSEEEYTVLLSPNIRNISAPLLLCGEDDVEGTHANSTGKLDEDKMFYLMTRGMSEADAKKIIVEAALAPILELVDDIKLKTDLSEYIRTRIDIK